MFYLFFTLYFSFHVGTLFFSLGGLGVEPWEPSVPAGDGSQYTMGLMEFPCRKWYSFGVVVVLVI